MNKSRRVTDFLSWMLQVPVLSEVAVEALGDLLLPNAQIFPLITFRRRSFFAINVTQEFDCLDWARSDVLYAPDQPTRVLRIASHIFLNTFVPTAPIFKAANDGQTVFVTDRFVQELRAHHLTGAALLDPGTDPFRLHLRGPLRDALDGYNTAA